MVKIKHSYVCIRTSKCLTIKQPCSKSYKVSSEASVPYLRYHEAFIPSQAHGGLSRNTRVSPSDVAVYGRRTTNIVQRRFGCLLAFCRTATAAVPRTSCINDYVVVPRTYCRDDFALCSRSGVVLRPQSFWRSAPAAVVLA